MNFINELNGFYVFFAILFVVGVIIFLPIAIKVGQERYPIVKRVGVLKEKNHNDWIDARNKTLGWMSIFLILGVACSGLWFGLSDDKSIHPAVFQILEITIPVLFISAGVTYFFQNYIKKNYLTNKSIE